MTVHYVDPQAEPARVSADGRVKYRHNTFATLQAAYDALPPLAVDAVIQCLPGTLRLPKQPPSDACGTHPAVLHCRGKVGSQNSDRVGAYEIVAPVTIRGPEDKPCTIHVGGEYQYGVYNDSLAPVGLENVVFEAISRCQAFMVAHKGSAIHATCLVGRGMGRVDIAVLAEDARCELHHCFWENVRRHFIRSTVGARVQVSGGVDDQLKPVSRGGRVWYQSPDLPTTYPAVRCDKSAYFEVFGNLIIDGRILARGGKLLFKGTYKERQTLEATIASHGDSVLLEYCDASKSRFILHGSHLNLYRCPPVTDVVNHGGSVSEMDDFEW